MKTIIVACGAGVATSTIICNSVKNLMEKNEIKYRIIQCSLNEVESYVDSADIVVASTPLAVELPVPFVLGISFITGIKKEQTEQQIIDSLKE